MNVPLKANVQCVDGDAGRLTCVIINPITRQLTHIVVDEKDPPYLKRLVPLDLIIAGTPDGVTLDCTRAQLSALRPVVEFEHPQGNGLHTLFAAKTYGRWPQNVGKTLPVSVDQERLAPEVVKIHQDSPVRATDGRVGQVVGFLVNPVTKKIAALIVGRKSWWKTIETRIVISQVDSFKPDLILLKLSKVQLQKVSAIQWQKRYI